MSLDEKEIKKIKQEIIDLSENINNKCNLYFLGSDPTRLKILMLLKNKREICVSDIAKIIRVTVSAISHQLSLLEKCGIVKSNRSGKTVCYSLTDKKIKLDI